jgi:hypothetical protein
MLAFGPLKISTALSSVDGKLPIFIGDEINLVCQMVDSAGKAVNCDGDTMGALITDSDGDTAVTPTVTAQWDDAGWFLVSFDAPATAGSYNLTLRRNGGDGDISTAGPLILQVQAR